MSRSCTPTFLGIIRKNRDRWPDKDDSPSFLPSTLQFQPSEVWRLLQHTHCGKPPASQDSPPPHKQCHHGALHYPHYSAKKSPLMFSVLAPADHQEFKILQAVLASILAASTTMQISSLFEFTIT
ncbi:hypothetical protein E2C01_003856 [Portunus trituberculatus]|uniref:Uncharacterized protein n=1 Tax=Portunus trituberculatus TaxID=210409 RepID=A0A5B7CSA3_PORTR|nr:hypothetical protein [Portunus trituberculatus]